MRVLLLACMALSACASPPWTNPRNPSADLQVDEAACDREAERMARLTQLGNAGGPATNCVGPQCATLEENRRIQQVAEAVSIKKNCMAGRGWRQ